MKKLFYKLALIVAAVLTGFEILFGSVLPRMVMASKDSYITRWSKFYNGGEPAADIIFLGSSRAQRHCDPEIVANRTHLSADVIAEPGAKIDVYERLYDDYLKKHPRPKILLISIDFTGLDSVIYLSFPEQFFPSINSSDRISEMREFNLIKYHKPFGYFYFKELYMETIERPFVDQHINGYLPVDAGWDGTMEGFIGKFPNGFNFKVYQPTMEKLFKFMAREKKAGVRCIGFIAPEYDEVWKYEKNRTSVIQQIYQYADIIKVPVWNFSDSSYKPCFNKAYFYNSQHLNKKGATVFSKDLSDSILRYYSVNHPGDNETR
jgi:hypothetical protein